MNRRTVTCAALAAMMLTACTGTDDTPETETSWDELTPGYVNLPDAGEPVEGGTLTFGAYAEPTVLDPAETIAAGSTGGLEMAALYDVLMRWDPVENEAVPQLAEDLNANEDSTAWTLTLREGVQFSDGSSLDAEAVIGSMERYVEEGGDEAMLWEENVVSAEAVDDHTVEIELAEPWPSFDHLLTTGPGMIVAPSSNAGDEFEPVGAGAFVLASQRPGEEIVLEANADYWGGPPRLDAIRVVFSNDPASVRDSFDSGEIDLAFLREPDIVHEQLTQDVPGFLNMVALGDAAVINATEGHAGSDPRVRRAMHMAIDPEVIAQRAYGDAGVPSNEVFPEYSTWHAGVDPLPVDPDAARELVEEAKADGFDGTVTYVDGSDPASRATAIAVEGSLEAIGLDVEVNLMRSIQEQITTISVDRDYDLAGWGISWREAGPYGRMFATLHSEGDLSVGMPTGDGFDGLFAEFRAAETEEEQRDVMGRVQEEWNEQVPAIAFGPTPEFVAYGDAVRGLEGTSNSMMLLDSAWLAD